MQRRLFDKPKKVQQQKPKVAPPKKTTPAANRTEYERRYPEMYGFNEEESKAFYLIQQRRLQILIHSCIYYKFNGNIISDRQYDIFGKELVQLQQQYPHVSEKVIWYEAFKDWDGNTGFDLPTNDAWVIEKANKLTHGK